MKESDTAVGMEERSVSELDGAGAPARTSAAIGGYLRAREHVFAEDTIRGVRNAWQSLRLFSLVALVAALMGVAAWAFLTCLDAVFAKPISSASRCCRRLASSRRGSIAGTAKTLRAAITW